VVGRFARRNLEHRPSRIVLPFSSANSSLRFLAEAAAWRSARKQQDFVWVGGMGRRALPPERPPGAVVDGVGGHGDTWLPRKGTQRPPNQASRARNSCMQRSRRDGGDASGVDAGTRCPGSSHRQAEDVGHATGLASVPGLSIKKEGPPACEQPSATVIVLSSADSDLQSLATCSPAKTTALMPRGCEA